jgi:hypothetical protein
MERYLHKYVSPDKAVELAIKSGDWVDFGFGNGFPELMDEALARITVVLGLIFAVINVAIARLQ